jgi:chromosome segregation ATPase
MSLFDASKKLNEANANLATANATIAIHAATIEKLTADLKAASDLAASIPDLNAQIVTLTENAKALAAVANKAGEDLAAEKAAHEATKLSVDALAATKSQQILGDSGHKGVEAKPASSSSIAAKLDAAKPGKEKMRILVENFDAIRTGGLGNQ